MKFANVYGQIDNLAAVSSNKSKKSKFQLINNRQCREGGKSYLKTTCKLSFSGVDKEFKSKEDCDEWLALVG